ncbi:hypothetical protein M5D96_008559, partial [Drosophila gunungcola]
VSLSFICLCLLACLLPPIFTIPKKRNKTTILLAAGFGSTAAASLKFYISIKVRGLKCFARRAVPKALGWLVQKARCHCHLANLGLLCCICARREWLLI